MGKERISIVILAAGFGTRMRSQTPKVMHKICGKEMLFCIIDEVLKFSDDISIVLFNEKEAIRSAIRAKYGESSALKIRIQDHENFPGTAGALMCGTREDLANPKALFPTKYENLLILSGDMPLVSAESLLAMCDSRALNRESNAESCEDSRAEIIMGILKLDNASGYGRVKMEGEKVKAIIEEKDADSAARAIKTANAGVYFIRRNFLESALLKITPNNAQREFYLTDIVQFSEKIVGKIVDSREFMGVNTKADLARAEDFACEKLREAAMKGGVIMHNPRTIFLEFGVRFEGECELESGVVLKGDSQIVKSRILAHSVVENSVIKNSDIGPFARIRPKCVIENSHIGDFVEAKNAQIHGAKAGHLSYLGDCEINEGTNIGAGTITCNYDGARKHRTKLGRRVFVGSGTQIVAPCEIADDVLIAAGSVVTKGAAQGDLVIARAKQQNKAGFFYKFFGSRA